MMPMSNFPQFLEQIGRACLPCFEWLPVIKPFVQPLRVYNGHNMQAETS
jgi:hypothetical protein